MILLTKNKVKPVNDVVAGCVFNRVDDMAAVIFKNPLYTYYLEKWRETWNGIPQSIFGQVYVDICLKIR